MYNCRLLQNLMYKNDLPDWRFALYKVPPEWPECLYFLFCRKRIAQRQKGMSEVFVSKVSDFKSEREDKIETEICYS